MGVLLRLLSRRKARFPKAASSCCLRRGIFSFSSRENDSGARSVASIVTVAEGNAELVPLNAVYYLSLAVLSGMTASEESYVNILFSVGPCVTVNTTPDYLRELTFWRGLQWSEPLRGD